MRQLAALALILITFPVSAESLSGKVVGVADGDTLTLLTAEHSQVRVRLAEIDAPEKSQAYGQASKQSLADLCFGKQAEVRVIDTDRYGRTVGRINCNGTDANLTQVQKGLAWAYRKYLHDNVILNAELQAKTARLGLWQDADPTPPWDYRHSARQ